MQTLRQDLRKFYKLGEKYAIYWLPPVLVEGLLPPWARLALSIGANTFQFFTRNPRGGAAKDIDPQDAQALVLMQGSGEIGKIVAHAPYTLNPCAKEEKTLEFARNTMQDDLRRMEFVPGNFYNFHPGSHVGQGTEEGIRKIAETLDLAMFEGQTTIVLLETMAGKGTEVGGRFEELRAIIDRTAMPGKARRVPRYVPCQRCRV